MFKEVNWNKIIFLAIFIVVASMLATVSFIFELTGKGYKPMWRNSEVVSAVASLEKEYPEKVTALFKKYSLPNEKLSTQQLQQLNEELLVLKVPPKYQSLHWQLVKDFDVLSRGSQVSTKQQIENEFRKIQQDYTWLSKTLAQLLLTIY